MSDRLHLFDLMPDALADAVTDLGLAKFRAKQVLEWVYGKGAASFEHMTNLSKRDRDTLSQHLDITTADVIAHQRASDGVEKLLMQWHRAPQAKAQGDHVLARAKTHAMHDTAGKRPDTPLPLVGNPAAQTECVMIPATSEQSRDRRTACISSQVGCAVGCTFCASGIGGLDGNLTAGQIVEQVWRLSHLPNGERITNIVFMGMGEPLANFAAVTRAVRTLMADWALHISGRRITVSTVGLPAHMRRLADEELPITLAISLHAPNDELRRKLIPWAEYVSVDALIDAGRHYFDKTGREITLEYILLRGVNDRPQHARELASVAKRLRSNVNLIRYNEVEGLAYKRPISDDVHAFQQALRSSGVNAHIRASRGRDIAAACGQLRHEATT